MLYSQELGDWFILLVNSGHTNDGVAVISAAGAS